MTKKKSTSKKAAPKKATATKTYTKKKEPVLVLPRHLTRRKVRYIMFRIKRDAVSTMDRDLRECADVIKAHFAKLMVSEGVNWAGFTFSWDVSPADPFKIIKKDLRRWVQEGGSFTGRPPGMTREQWATHVTRSMLQNWETPPLPLEPPAFTNQV